MKVNRSPSADPSRSTNERSISLRIRRWIAALGLPLLITGSVLVLGSAGAGAAASNTGTVKVYPIPTTMVMVPAPKAKAGPEILNSIPIGPKLAGLSKAATGQTVDGVQCETDEQLVSHVHSHLTIFVNGKARVIPYGIGIPGYGTEPARGGNFVDTGNCFYWLHTHAEDGIIHVESPSLKKHFTLGQFFKEWGIPLSATQVGPAKGVVTTFFEGYLYKGNPANLPLGSHVQIQLDVGTPIVAPVKVTNWGGL